MLVVMQVADDGAPDHRARTGREPLQHAECPQVMYGMRSGAAEAGDGENGQTDQDDVAPPESVGERAVPQRHGRKRDHVGGQGLLDFEFAGMQRGLNLREGGQIGIN